MKPTPTTVALAVGALCVSCGAMREGGQCVTSVSSVSSALHDANDNLGHLLHECVAPLLYMGFKYIDASQATSYCEAEACVKLMARLKQYPACTWRSIPSDTQDNDLLTAKRVLQDCADA